MNRIVKVLLFCMMGLCCFTVSVYAQTKPRLAILPFTGGTGGDGETIASLLVNQEDLRTAFTVMDRTSNITIITKEQQFQRSSGLTDSDTIARLGHQYGADFVVAGHIQTLGDQNLVLITIIQVESLQQIAGAYQEYKQIPEIRAQLPSIAKKLADASKTDKTQLPKLAVFPFIIRNGVKASDAEVLAQLLATDIANGGKYAVLPRTSSIQKAMDEQKIQREGLIEEDSIKSIGKALNAQYVLGGTVRTLGQGSASENLFDVKIYNVETADMINGKDRSYSSISDGTKLMAELARTLTANMPGVSSSPTPISRSLDATVPSPVKYSRSDFSTGRKIGAGFLNLALGVGSFTMEDWGGGFTLFAGYVVAGALFVIEATALDWDNPAVGVPATIGIAVVGLTAAYGFVRPFIYNRSPKTAVLLDTMHIDIVPASSNESGIAQKPGVRFAYTFKLY
ncbi:hypothetical protein AGMMS49940_21390 [Spirochaetia bacterium]|nr:hypothetical protein AGMMS49940_21390 [Spirochaetia bacterium]